MTSAGCMRTMAAIWPNFELYLTGVSNKPSLYNSAKRKATSNYSSVEKLASTHKRRIVDISLVCEAADDNPTKAARLFRKKGITLLSHRECPNLLSSGQILLWPSEEERPDNQVVLPLSPPYNPHDGRFFKPKHMLAERELTDALFEGDCLELLPYFPDHSVDLVLCDLPYGTTQNKWDSVIPLEPLWKQYKRILKPKGAVVLTAHGIFTAKLILSNESWFKYKIVWEKSKPTNFLNAKKQPLRKHEDICVFYKGQPIYNPEMTTGEPYDKGVRKNQLSGSYGNFLPARVRSAGQRYPTDIVYFKTAESEGPVWHPTQKPVELGRYFVRTFTNPGALVLDNAFGSGSFLVAAAMEKRRYVGIERNQDVHQFKRIQIDYVGVARQRIKQLISQADDKP